MQIQPQYQTVAVLLKDRLFRIPEYQRAYSWQTKQRQDLFADIAKIYKSNGDSVHFMATIVGLRRKKRTIASDEFFEIDVVDGQQRLTTLAILLKAISKALRTDDPKHADEIDGLLVKGDDLSLLLLQTNHDSSHIFIDYLREGAIPSNKPIETAADRNLARAISECEEFVGSWATGHGGSPLDMFATVKNRLSVIFHEIEDEALVYTVFEVLNSRGLDVTWFDKLKSLLMAIVFEYGEAGSKEETVSEMHTLWTKIYSTIGLRQTLNRETLRFAGTLRVKECPSRPISEDVAAGVLVAGCGNNPRKVMECTKWLLKVTQAENRILEDHRLSAATQIVQARVVAIAVLLRQFSEEDQVAILKVWESVTFRIFGIARKDARTKVGEYIRLAWRITNERLTPSGIVEQLKEIGKDFPMKSVIAALSNRDCYQGWTEQLRYLLFRYEEYLAAKAGQSLNTSMWNRIWADEPSRSIEHIRPRSKGSEDRGTKAIFVHRLGNLTMLPPKVNSSLQDKEPKEKASTYNTCGLMVTAEVGRFVKAAKWDRIAVEKRERRLLRWASSEWQD
jgi:hypothetical protein